MKTSNKIFIIILSVGLLVALVEVGYLYTKRDKLFATSTPMSLATSTPTANLFIRRLDGIAVANAEEATSSILGLMIDNHPDARPQSGLSQARVVYEVPVEGGITRFFALFDINDTVAKVGPVRSSRPYFLDWLSEYGNTSYWHSGGSQEALDLIKQYKIWDVNEFYFGPYFWRSAGKEAPHNLYTSSDKWQILISGTPHSVKDWQGWLFSPILSESFTAADVTQLQIKYEKNYLVSWVYDAATERYLRYQNGNLVLDESGSQIFANTVIVQEMDVEVVDNEGRKDISTIGRGDARVLMDGKSVRGYWKKGSRTERTRFYDAGNREIPLHPGKIWLEIVPQNTAMEVSS
ncbi:MAG: DUF3048 domain-containing protein [Patescibacteria group bacterium]|jgi:hypothetical protein